MKFHGTCTLDTKLSIIRIFKLAFGAIHFYALLYLLEQFEIGVKKIWMITKTIS
jgi:hypothetical protein